MRLALLADIHGNLAALEAVLADADAQGAEVIVAAGDHLATGPGRSRRLRCCKSGAPF